MKQVTDYAQAQANGERKLVEAIREQRRKYDQKTRAKKAAAKPCKAAAASTRPRTDRAADNPAPVVPSGRRRRERDAVPATVLPSVLPEVAERGEGEDEASRLQAAKHEVSGRLPVPTQPDSIGADTHAPQAGEALEADSARDGLPLAGQVLLQVAALEAERLRPSGGFATLYGPRPVTEAGLAEVKPIVTHYRSVLGLTEPMGSTEAARVAALVCGGECAVSTVRNQVVRLKHRGHREFRCDDIELARWIIAYGRLRYGT
jgi:hypothetical protein